MIFFIICAFELITQQKIEKISFFNKHRFINNLEK